MEKPERGRAPGSSAGMGTVRRVILLRLEPGRADRDEDRALKARDGADEPALGLDGRRG